MVFFGPGAANAHRSPREKPGPVSHALMLRFAGRPLKFLPPTWHGLARFEHQGLSRTRAVS